jgi:transglutaminase-like putative cysteine protease
MQKRFKFYLTSPVIVLFVLISAFIAKASNPAVHVSPKPTWLSACKSYNQKPSARTIENGYFYALIEQQVQVEKQADYHHVIKEIISETGIQNASQINVGFDPSFQRLDFHEIIVWRAGKPINRLNVSGFKVIADEKDLSNFIYQGSYSALLILDDIRKGDRIEYSYTLTGRNPIFSGRYCDDITLQWYQPIAHQYTVLIASAQRKLNFKAFNTIPKATVTESSGLRRYEYEAFQVPAARDDDTQPAWYEGRARVQISEFNSWAEVVNWSLGINPADINIKGELAARIAEIKAKTGTDKVKYFREAVRTVQDEVRYMGIEIGQYSHRANNPEKVFKQRYGDCKDKSLLLVSMLKAGGIDASMVLVNSGVREHIADYIPTYYAFDHAVVTANVNGKQVWVDATIDYQGGTGTDIYFPNYAMGLVLKAGNTSLTSIPPSKAGKIVFNDIYKIKNDKAPVEFTVKTIYTLNEADDIRNRLASSGMAETEKNYLEYYAKTYSKIEPKDSVTVTDDLEKNVLTTKETYIIKDFFRTDSETNKRSVDLYANYISQQLPSINGQTKTPVSLSYPLNYDYTISVILPGGWDITTRNEAFNRDYYKFASDYSVSGDTLLLNYKLNYLKDYVPAIKLTEFRADIKKLNYDGLSYSFSYGTVHEPKLSVNGYMVMLAGFLTVGLMFLGVWVYQRETPGIVFSHGTTFSPIGGWLILVAIGLGATAINVLINLYTGKFFELGYWNSFSEKFTLNYRILIVTTVVGNIILMGYAIFNLILLLNKRDILPKAIIGYFAYSTVFAFIYYFITLTTQGPQQYKLNQEAQFALVRAILVSIIWISYFRKSSRVEHTFIVPHPPYNYSYEGPDAHHSESK